MTKGLDKAHLNLLHACPHSGYDARGGVIPLLTGLGGPHVSVKPHYACSHSPTASLTPCPCSLAVQVAGVQELNDAEYDT